MDIDHAANAVGPRCVLITRLRQIKSIDRLLNVFFWLRLSREQFLHTRRSPPLAFPGDNESTFPNAALLLEQRRKWWIGNKRIAQ